MRFAQLSHIKEVASASLESNASLFSKSSRRIAWPGGKVTSNKQEALLKFLTRKREATYKLTKDQLKLVEEVKPFSKGNGFTTTSKSTIGLSKNGILKRLSTTSTTTTGNNKPTTPNQNKRRIVDMTEENVSNSKLRIDMKSNPRKQNGAHGSMVINGHVLGDQVVKRKVPRKVRAGKYRASDVYDTDMKLNMSLDSIIMGK